MQLAKEWPTNISPGENAQILGVLQNMTKASMATQTVNTNITNAIGVLTSKLGAAAEEEAEEAEPETDPSQEPLS